MKVVVGLGNFGGNYDGTRHNLGFYVLNKLAVELGVAAMWQEKVKFKAIVTESQVGDEKIVLARPTTYYNLSGEAVLAIKNFYKIDNKDILVIHDELDLPFGTIRSRSAGSDAGNNGIKNINQLIGEDYARIRLGIKNDQLDQYNASEFVLSRFSKEEEAKLPEITDSALELVARFLNGEDTSTTQKTDL